MRLGACTAACLAVLMACDGNRGSSEEASDAGWDAGLPALDAAVQTDGGASDAGGEDAAPLGHQESLDALGVDTDLSDYPEGLSPGYHPLRRPITTLDQRDELLYMKRGTSSAHLFDDATEPATAPSAVGTPSIASAGWIGAEDEAAVAADINGDGDDEIVVFWFEESSSTLSMYVVDQDDAGTFFITGEGQPVIEGVTTRPPWDWFEDAVVPAQLDADAAEEIVIGFGTLLMLDYHDGVDDTFEVLQPMQAGEAMSVTGDQIDIGVGDLDNVPGDQSDEVVVTHSQGGSVAGIEIFDGFEHVATRSGQFMLNGTEAHTSISLRVEVGNFDPRDDEDEIVFFGHRIEYDNIWVLTLMDGQSGDYAWYHNFSRWIGDVSDGRVSIQLRKIDVDGDRVPEAFVDHYIIGDFHTLPLPTSTEPADASGPNLRVIEAALTRVSGGIPPEISDGRVHVAMVGNVAAQAPADGQTRAPLAEELIGVEYFGSLVYGSLENDAWVWRDLGVTGGSGADTIVAGNFDRDSVQVRYRGEHELLFSSPKPIALLSAPPFWAADTGVEQSLGNCYTAFGKGTGNEVSTSESMSFSSGWSIGYEAGIDGIVKAEASVSFEQKFDSITTSGLEQQQWITYATGAEDSVVFTSVPFDVYYYDVITSPVDAEENTIISVNIPRRPQTSLVSAAFYDRHRGATPKVAPLFTHTVGDPRSYPSEADFHLACQNNHSCYSSSSETIGEGGGFTELYISSASNRSQTTDYEYSVTASAKLTAGGVSFGKSVGFGYGFGMTFKTQESTAFTGRVSNIVDRTAETAYNFGLFARQVPFGDELGNEVLLVDYWVK
jgi:hypothetical protein